MIVDGRYASRKAAAKRFPCIQAYNGFSDRVELGITKEHSRATDRTFHSPAESQDAPFALAI
jgi:hypothetical protein